MVERIRKIIECSGLSDRAFAIKCGINQPTLFNQLKGIRAVSLDTVLAISKTFPDVSRDWLLLGEGDMTKELVLTKELERINKLNGIVESLQEVIDAKNSAITTMTERIKQLENQLNTK
ncbi:MAG: XRE family transcriptional regulator [Muribaculaceae bacterium]|nr:XRE family transcriptional regulator [Muribaculaceae bacterium]